MSIFFSFFFFSCTEWILSATSTNLKLSQLQPLGCKHNTKLIPGYLFIYLFYFIYTVLPKNLLCSGANKTGFSPCYVVYAALFLPVTHHRLITLLQVFLCAYDSRVLFMNYARGGCLCPWVKLYNGVRQRMYGVYVDICLCVHDAYGAENVCEREKEKEREKERER